MMFSQDVRNVVWDLICINVIACNVLFAVHCMTLICPYVMRAWRRAKYAVTLRWHSAVRDVTVNDIAMMTHSTIVLRREIIKLEDNANDTKRRVSKLERELSTMKIQQELDQRHRRRASLRSAGKW